MHEVIYVHHCFVTGDCYGLIHEVIYLVVRSLPAWLFFSQYTCQKTCQKLKSHTSAGALYALTLRVKPSMKVPATPPLFLRK
jgi:hypothetical protein